MGRAGQRFSNGGEITFTPDDIAAVFEEADINTTWDYLETTFHISKLWRADYKRKLSSTPRKIAPQEFFVQYCLERIDEPLKILLQRRESVIFAILRYLLKHRIDEKKRLDRHKERYRYR